jgi:hypothetical protein
MRFPRVPRASFFDLILLRLFVYSIPVRAAPLWFPFAAKKFADIWAELIAVLNYASPA